MVNRIPIGIAGGTPLGTSSRLCISQEKHQIPSIGLAMPIYPLVYVYLEIAEQTFTKTDTEGYHKNLLSTYSNSELKTDTLSCAHLEVEF